MQILIGCAKIMTGCAPSDISFATEPTFQSQANDNAMQMLNYSVEELCEMLHINRDMALENWKRFRSFHDNSIRQPAAFCYDGMVYQRLAPETLSDSELRYANDHLMISSFLYGILRPLDIINKYRLEGNVILPNNNSKSMFDFWKPILTDWFINKIKADDGILIYLASDEMRNLFDWKRVKSEVKVITPTFKVDKNGKLKTIVIYTKMCRGAMARYIIKNRITNIDELKSFEYEGFSIDDSNEEWNYIL
ncbi:MAG: YaaA family protein [Prevotella sp.]|nr:YaaA family protein [Prevotella sp.]MBP8687790.1 YaaA family protein [Prevotella sp.]MBP8936498.1 YaaA family protein [Prevotella sp.]